MDVRKWLIKKLTGMYFLGEYCLTESLPSDYTETITRELEPAITKLVEALVLYRRDHYYMNQDRDCGCKTCMVSIAALAELEKP